MTSSPPNAAQGKQPNHGILKNKHETGPVASPSDASPATSTSAPIQLADSAPSTPPTTQHDAHPPAITWDEQNLETNEAERVPRQKITEPKTPYHPPVSAFSSTSSRSESSSSTATAFAGLPKMSLDDKITEAAQQGHKDASSSDESDTEAQYVAETITPADIARKEAARAKDPNAQAKHEQFLDKRHSHYKNEANPKALLSQKVQDDSDEDDMNDGADQPASTTSSSSSLLAQTNQPSPLMEPKTKKPKAGDD